MYVSTRGAVRPGDAASAPLPKASQGPHRLDGAAGPSGVRLYSCPGHTFSCYFSPSLLFPGGTSSPS